MHLTSLFSTNLYRIVELAQNRQWEQKAKIVHEGLSWVSETPGQPRTKI